MTLLTRDTPMSVALENHTSLIPLISRFGIRLGLGDKSIEQVCRQYEIDPLFMLTLMNTFLFDDYFPEQKLRSFHINQIVDYLSKTNAYYLHFQIPNIERHLRSLIHSGEENKNLTLIGTFFEKFKQEMISSIQDDQQRWFPLCLRVAGRGEPQAVIESDTELPVDSLLKDLLSIIVRHLSGKYDDNLAYAVIFALTSLERDIRQHHRIRTRILNPAINQLCHK